MTSPPAFDAWVAQRGDALLRVLTRWDRIAAADDIDAYVRRMLVNAHTSWWRRWRRREVPMREVRDSVVLAPADPDDRLWRACLALPEAQRTAVVLRYYEQLEHEEIAAVTGVREGTVRSRVSRGLAALRTELTPLEDLR